MKIIDINTWRSSHIIISNYNLNTDTIEEIINFIYDNFDFEIANYSGNDLNKDIPVLVRNSINKFKDTLLSKRLMKEFLIDKYFFEMFETFMCNQMLNSTSD